MKKIIVASNNSVKTQATENGFRKMFPHEIFEIESISVPSGVNDQPMSDKETLKGAVNRVNNASQAIVNVDYWVGIEGGIEETNGEMAAFAWVVIKSKTLTGKSKSGTFYLPQKIANKIRNGIEMGEVNDIIFGLKNSKQHNGAIGILTKNVIDRLQLYEHAVVLALVSFKNIELYK